MIVQARNPQVSKHSSVGQSRGFVASNHDEAPYANGSKQFPSRFGIGRSAINKIKFVKR